MIFDESVAHHKKVQEISAWRSKRNQRAAPRAKSLIQFIRDNRKEIDAAIRRVCDCRLNDRERRLWVLNDEGLYLWARSEGVRI